MKGGRIIMKIFIQKKLFLSILHKVVLVSIVPYALSFADVKFSLPGFDHELIFKENGDLALDGKVFTNIPIAKMPVEGVFGMFPDPSSDPKPNEPPGPPPKIAIANVYIFMTGNFHQYSTSFPGPIKVKNSSGVVIASFNTDGHMYIRGGKISTGTCIQSYWEPSKWNDKSVQNRNNCYNYGNNQVTFSYAQPGRAAGNPLPSPPTIYTGEDVKQAAISDGLEWIGETFPGNSYTCSNGGSLVFLAYSSPGFSGSYRIRLDYHWYRFDKTAGKWTHKPGEDPSTDKDASGNTIDNPIWANREYWNENGTSYVYNEAVGFFCTCGSNANIR
jgi:hypothetical protein